MACTAGGYASQPTERNQNYIRFSDWVSDSAMNLTCNAKQSVRRRFECTVLGPGNEDTGCVGALRPLVV